MSIKDQIREDMKSAMKSGDKARLETIRMAQAAIRKREIDSRTDRENQGDVSLDDAAVIEVLSSLIKQRRESADQYRAGKREDLAGKEEAEIAVLQGYLPAQLSAAEVEALVREAITQTGAASPKDMGKVMGVLMPKVKGRADGKLVNEKVKTLLGG